MFLFKFLKLAFTFTVFFITTQLLMGCSSSAYDDQMAKYEHQLAAEEIAQARAEQKLSKIPKWALEKHPVDSRAVYAVGIGQSNTLNLSLQKSQIDAQMKIAEKMNSQITAQVRSVSADSMNIESNSSYERLVDNLIQSDVSGFEIVKQQIVPIHGQYHTFMLVELTFKEFNRIVQEKMKDELDASNKQKFKDLLDRVQPLANDDAVVTPFVANNNNLNGLNPIDLSDNLE
ncbi:LPP20 family lipoprotein [Paraphotobacterium marinum]|nr:LPP20 family lipoprotein [Paraphotobacterium marinum]